MCQGLIAPEFAGVDLGLAEKLADPPYDCRRFHGAGKSYLAGLLAERWIDTGYALLVLDPEGDHVGLTQRPGVHLVDAATHLPTPADLLAIARPGRASLVLDLSGLPQSGKSAYLHRLPAAIAAERAEHGIPHWVITDEADLAQQNRPGARLC